MAREPSFGVCARCRQDVSRDVQAYRALGRLYHHRCFACTVCSKTLEQQPFYSVLDQLFCEDHFMHSEVHRSKEICDSCGAPIKEKVLQAFNCVYHPACFCCVVCLQSLEGAQFCLDNANRVYCLRDYCRYIAPVCAGCGLPILPAEGSLVTERIVSMDRDYHVGCLHQGARRIQS
ncbi:LIM domain-containing protein 1-like [Engraulis encrasicolus]|uniref:LIM domain-containing protein 1-like n=1 Tax=Engraulis encrasicolus TaxID=184585 RepID=UPI002FD744DA